MSLLENAYEAFCVMDKTKVVADGYGGTKNSWSDGVEFSGAIVYESSVQAKIAQSMGATGGYSLYVKKNVLLDYYDVVKRMSDGKTFRVTADSDERQTPKGAGLNVRVYDCEEWKIPEVHE